MVRAFLNSEKGFTLIELLVAIVILIVGLLGLLQALDIAMNHNMLNQMRNEAAIVADTEIAQDIGGGYNAIQSNPSTVRVVRNRQVLAIWKCYTIVKHVSANSSNNYKMLSYQVNWHYKGGSYNHLASAAITKPQSH